MMCESVRLADQLMSSIIIATSISERFACPISTEETSTSYIRRYFLIMLRQREKKIAEQMKKRGHGRVASTSRHTNPSGHGQAFTVVRHCNDLDHKGSLLTGLPTELLYKVLAFLPPITLVHLSRTCKSFQISLSFKIAIVFGMTASRLR